MNVTFRIKWQKFDMLKVSIVLLCFSQVCFNVECHRLWNAQMFSNLHQSLINNITVSLNHELNDGVILLVIQKLK